jgi:hypothetical protein
MIIIIIIIIHTVRYKRQSSSSVVHGVSEQVGYRMLLPHLSTLLLLCISPHSDVC